jgi:hypothetical protein
MTVHFRRVNTHKSDSNAFAKDIGQAGQRDRTRVAVVALVEHDAAKGISLDRMEGLWRMAVGLKGKKSLAIKKKQRT